MKGRAADTSMEKLAKLRPAFHVRAPSTAGIRRRRARRLGRLVMSADRARELGLLPLGRFVAFACRCRTRAFRHRRYPQSEKR